MRRINSRASIMHEVIIHLIIIGLIFGLFFMATVSKVNSRAARQQVIEKQLALLIDSAEPGMTFSINKINRFGAISRIEIKDQRIYGDVDGLKSSKGYPIFSRYTLAVSDTGEAFNIIVK